jgi:uncharacterized protein with HEPN domain
MRDMRNVVVHQYFGVDLRVVWDMAPNILPPLVQPLRHVMASEPADEA